MKTIQLRKLNSVHIELENLSEGSGSRTSFYNTVIKTESGPSYDYSFEQFCASQILDVDGKKEGLI